MAGQPDRPRWRVPSSLPLPPWRLASPKVQRSYDAAAARPSDPEANTKPAPAVAQDDGVPAAHVEPAAELAASGWTAAMFVLSAIGSLLFCVSYVAAPRLRDLGLDINLLLGSGLGIAMAGLSLGFISLGKTGAPPVHAVQDRAPHPAPEADERAAEAAVVSGPVELGLTQRRFVRRSLLAALGALPFPFLFGLRDLGPQPSKQLRESAWGAGDLMVDPDTRRPVKLADIDIGGLVTVLPERFIDPNLPVMSESVVVLMRLPPGVNHPLPGRANWAADGVVAYSKVCTHAGCPVGLYEHDVEQLLCPCHQSTFDVPNGCRVIFGPAARPLPQLPLTVDAQGYLRAASGFHEPVGPSFWERT